MAADGGFGVEWSDGRSERMLSVALVCLNYLHMPLVSAVVMKWLTHSSCPTHEHHQTHTQSQARNALLMYFDFRPGSS